MHPLVKFFFSELSLQLRVDSTLTRRALMRQAGLSREHFRQWEHGVTPRIDTFDAALRTLGYRLSIKMIKE